MDPEREQVHDRRSHRKLQSQSTVDLFSLSSPHEMQMRDREKLVEKDRGGWRGCC